MVQKTMNIPFLLHNNEVVGAECNSWHCDPLGVCPHDEYFVICKIKQNEYKSISMSDSSCNFYTLLKLFSLNKMKQFNAVCTLIQAINNEAIIVINLVLNILQHDVLVLNYEFTNDHKFYSTFHCLPLLYCLGTTIRSQQWRTLQPPC